MNATLTAKRGYLGSVSTVRSERRTEYEVLSRITHKLREAAVHSKSDFPALVKSLNDNRAIWQAFSLDVADEGNSLPKQLRASIFYLAEFTDHQTRKILAGQGSVLPLLEINMAVLRGLKPAGTTP